MGEKKAMGEERRTIKMCRGLRAAVGAALLALLLTGCTLMSEEKVKLRDLEFTILSEEKIPQELMTIIEEKQGEPFKLTYSDNENLYISIGYGEQSSGGFSITVNELYLTENAIYVNTTLLGPDASENAKKAVSCPYIVIKTELLEETVIFE